MAKQLVFIHGRAQEHKDAVALKAEWVGALTKGMAASGLEMPVGEEHIRFPYYGQTLYDLASGKAGMDVAEVMIKSGGEEDAELMFVRAALRETLTAAGITDAQIDDVMGVVTVDKGILNWEWVHSAMKALDTFVPHAGAASIALATADVYQYLHNPAICRQIEDGVRKAIQSDTPSVVVSHSLGTVVAYKMLCKEGLKQGWRVPLFITLGSPLGLKEIKKRLAPLATPTCVDRWFNAMDERDVVALYPLDAKHFPVSPAIENKRDVNNHTSNRHGISGYLDDPVVARKIHDALTS